MKNAPNWLKIGFVVVALLCFLVFVQRTAPTISPLQLEYERWYQGLENRLADQQAEPVALTLSGNIGTDVVTWELSSQTKRVELARLLSLLKEGKAFSAAGTKADPIMLQVRAGNLIFSTRLNEQRLRENVPLQNLLELFKLYQAPEHS